MFSLSKSAKKRVPIATKMQSGRSGERVLIVNVCVSVIVGGGCVFDVVEIEVPPTSYLGHLSEQKPFSCCSGPPMQLQCVAPRFPWRFAGSLHCAPPRSLWIPTRRLTYLSLLVIRGLFLLCEHRLPAHSCAPCNPPLIPTGPYIS